MKLSDALVLDVFALPVHTPVTLPLCPPRHVLSLLHLRQLLLHSFPQLLSLGAPLLPFYDKSRLIGAGATPGGKGGADNKTN